MLVKPFNYAKFQTGIMDVYKTVLWFAKNETADGFFPGYKAPELFFKYDSKNRIAFYNSRENSIIFNSRLLEHPSFCYLTDKTERIVGEARKAPFCSFLNVLIPKVMFRHSEIDALPTDYKINFLNASENLAFGVSFLLHEARHSLQKFIKTSFHNVKRSNKSFLITDKPITKQNNEPLTKICSYLANPLEIDAYSYTAKWFPKLVSKLNLSVNDNLMNVICKKDKSYAVAGLRTRKLSFRKDIF